MQLEIIHSAYKGGDETPWLGEIDAQDNNDAPFSPAIGIAVAPLTGLEFRANAGRYVRIPDLLELFGDRGMTVGNPSLVPESGINADAGVMYSQRDLGVLAQVQLSGGWFARWADDLIAYVQTQNVLKPENIDSARIMGFETELFFEFVKVLRIEANYTFTDAVNTSEQTYYNGNQLPGIPAHEAWLRTSFFKRSSFVDAELRVDGDYAGSNYLTPYNSTEQVVARFYIGLGGQLSFVSTGLSVSLDVRNLLNRISATDENGSERPLMDYEGFPLPGRTVFATLRWRISP